MATVLNQLQRSIATTLAAALLVGVAGCDSNRISTAPQPSVSPSSSPSPTVATTPPTNTVESPAAPSPTSQPFTTTASPSPATATDTVTVTIYKADSQCADFVSESVRVSEERSMEAAIGKVIEAQSSADFDLSGYRVSQDANGQVTVDFRLAPGSQRQMTSLSTCEQFALFGSLRETLTRNPQWQVKSVRFTERGEEIVL